MDSQLPLVRGDVVMVFADPSKREQPELFAAELRAAFKSLR